MRPARAGRARPRPARWRAAPSPAGIVTPSSSASAATRSRVPRRSPDSRSSSSPSSPCRHADQRFWSIRHVSATGRRSPASWRSARRLTSACTKRADRRRLLDRALRVRHAHLDGAERRMQAQLPPPLARVLEAAPPQRALVGLEALERGRDALAREQPRDPRADRRQPAVAALVERRVGGRRRQLGQVRPQRVVDGERAVGAADRHVHVQAEHELAVRDGRILGADRPVALAGVERPGAGRERVRAGARDPEAGGAPPRDPRGRGPARGPPRPPSKTAP